MADTRLDDGNAGLLQPVLDLRPQGLRNVRGVTAQCGALAFMGFIRVGGREVPQRRLTLDLYELFVIIDLEQCLSRVVHFPDDDGRNLDRAATRIIDLELAALEVSHAGRYRGLRIERIRPFEPWFVHGTNVLAEQLHHLRLVRMHHEQAGPAEQDQQRCEPGSNDAGQRRCHRRPEDQVAEAQLRRCQHHEHQVSRRDCPYLFSEHGLLLS